MKHKPTLWLLSAAVLFWITLPVSTHTLTAKSERTIAGKEVQEQQDWTERDEINRSYQLSPGARVEVSMIYGPVDIETGDANTAEVHIVRSARLREDLESRKITIEHTPTSLLIRGEQDHSEGAAKVRHRVLLKIPRQVELFVAKVNARLNVGETNGTIHLSRINGTVKVARATGSAEISQINGSLSITLTRLGEQGIVVDHVNGAVDLRFAEDLNADLKVTAHNGSVNVEVPNVMVIEKSARSVFRARIGSGGLPISISDVNGSVHLARTPSY